MPCSILNAVPADAAPNAAAFLRACPRGAYTALTVIGGQLVRMRRGNGGKSTAELALLRPYSQPHSFTTQIPHWQWHTERLASSLVELATSDPSALPAFTAWHGGGPEAASPLPLASHLSNVALPSLAAAVRGEAADAPSGADIGAILLLTDAAMPQPSSGFAIEPPLDVRAYAWALPPASERSRPGPATVVGPPRTNPSIKDSAWAAARAGLEAALPPGAADGILTSACDGGGGGALLEGLVTNLFVVQRGGPPGAAFTLRTAAPADGALDGIVRRMVLDLAQSEDGLAVDEAPPDPAQAGEWTEAFLTSAVRGVQPLTALVGPGRGGERGGGAVAWQTGFDPVPGPVTLRIMARLGAALAEHATRLPRE